MASKITKLTEEAAALIPDVREEWLAVGLSTAPTDREAAVEGVKAAYAAADLPMPGLVIWLQSPFAGAVGATLLSQARDQIVGAQVGAQVRDQVRAQVRDQVRAQVGAQVWDQVGVQVWDQVGVQVWDQVGVQVWDQVGVQVRDQVRAQVRDQVWDQVGAQVRVQVIRAGYGQHDASWLSFHDLFHRAYKLKATERLHGLNEIAKAAGWWWPFAGAVILTERPIRLSRDTEGRLHDESGAALLYSDEWGIWAWHGVRVPRDVIEQPGLLTADRILGEQNAEIRRVMLERAGYETVLEKATRVHKDKTGALWRLDLPDDEPLMLADVIDPSTGRRYFLRVDPNAYGGLETARAAVASTWRNQDGSLTFKRPEDYVLAAEA